MAPMVTKHVADLDARGAGHGSLLVRKWLDVPDGITMSGQGRIAISNHNLHCVMIYESGRQLDENSDPDGVMRGIFYPHGVRFTDDEAFLLIADAGAPYLHVYVADGGWSGVHQPQFSLRVVGDADFQRGRRNLQEGGPKGFDIDEAGKLLATTCEMQPLAFFDLAAILETAARNVERNRSGQPSGPKSASQVKCELDLLQVRRGADADLLSAAQ
jgi:hypothetical protein